MPVLVFAESTDSVCKKAAFEAVTYGAKLAAKLDTNCLALTISGPENASELGKYGAHEVFDVPLGWKHLDTSIYSKIIADAAEKLGADTVVLSHSSTGRSLAGRLAIRLKAGLVSGANALPDNGDDGLQVRKSVYSGKALGHYKIIAPVRIISVMGNAFSPLVTGDAVEVTSLEIPTEKSKIEIQSVSKVEGSVPLPEADLVVSGGRGLKGPENWGLIEDLAKALGAATACSRPVADSGWRPHHEHVGQTGVAIRPNLYIAIGISGAIQHLGGVNNSKTIVVINKDPEAPFFKAADYGVVADLFEVVPKLTEAVQAFKAQ